MESHSFVSLVSLFLALAVSQATLPPQVYWNSVLPNTPMPKAIKEILRPNFEEYKGSDENGGDKHRLGSHGSNANISISYDEDISISYDEGKNGHHRHRLGSHGSNANISISYDADKNGHHRYRLGSHGSNANISISYDGEKNGHHRHRLGSHGGATANATVSYNSNVTVSYDSNVTVSYDGGKKFHGEPKATIFFLLKDMVPGTKMNLDFPKIENDVFFMPRHIAHSIPFSSKEFPEILKKLSVEPESIDANVMKTTVKTCEQPGIKGEDKFCATSLESMIDFTTSNLGKEVQAVSSEVQKVNQMKKYKFMYGIKKLVDDKSVVCHKLNYPYAVFYCHAIPSTSVYMVPLQAVDGSRAKAVAVCHKDTSAWNPNHVAFQMVKIKPGTLPICHFPEDSVIWGRK